MTDARLTLFVMLPLVLLLARFTSVGPVALYCGVKLIDAVKHGLRMNRDFMTNHEEVMS